MSYYILVATYGSDIISLSFDSTTLELNVSSSTTVGHRPSWLASHPSRPSLVWTGLEQVDGKVLSLKFDDRARGKVVFEVSSTGDDPCCLLVLEEEILVANYSSGNITVLPVLSKDPLQILSAFPIHMSGSGPNKSRQGSSHPHQVILHEEYEELFVPDLGADSVLRFKKSKEDGSWNLKDRIPFEAGSGPRHVAFYKDNLFTVLELTNKVTRHRLPQLPSQPTLVKSTPTMSNPLPLPNRMLASEILIPSTNASFRTPYLYLSNRNDPSPDGDIISIYAIEEEDALELVAEVKSGLVHLRGMVFGGPDNKFLIAGGAEGGGVKIFERINCGRGLKEIACVASVEKPTGFLWL